MSDGHSWAQIVIGGSCPAIFVKALAYEIHKASEFEIPGGREGAVTYLESLIIDDNIVFEKDFAINGRFQSLEDWCRLHNLPYDRRCGGCDEWGANITYYRPGTSKIVNYYLEDPWGSGDVLCLASYVLKAREALHKGDVHTALDQLEEAVGGLSQVTPLPPFRIVKSDLND